MQIRECASVWRYPKFWMIPIPILFSGTKYFRYRYRYFFRYQIFPIPVPRLFSGTKFYRYRFRYFFPVPNFYDTGSDTTRKNEKFPVPVLVPIINVLNAKKLSKKICSGTKFFRYRFRDLFLVLNFSDTGSGTFSGTKFFRYQFRDFFRYQILTIPVARFFPVPIFQFPVRHTLLWMYETLRRNKHNCSSSSSHDRRLQICFNLSKTDSSATKPSIIILSNIHWKFFAN